MTGAGAPRRWQRVAEVSRKVLGMRYRSMPYLYTQHFNAHTSGCPAARPLTFTFPADNATRNVSDQWMLGDALMVSPIIYQARCRGPPCRLLRAAGMVSARARRQTYQRQLSDLARAVERSQTACMLCSISKGHPISDLKLCL